MNIFPLNIIYLPAAMLVYFIINIVIVGSISCVAFFLIKKWGERRIIYKSSVKTQQLRNELNYAFPTLAVDSVLTVLLLQAGLLKFQASGSWLLTIALFIIHFIFFEIWFYASHRIQHTRLLFVSHGVHHQSRVCTPLTGFSGTILDRMFSAVGFVFPHLVFSQMNLLDIKTFYLTIVLTTVGSVIIHSNVEVIGLLQNRIWRRIFAPVSAHALHHSRIHGNYGLYTSFMDRLGGTYIQDTDWLAQKASEGSALDSLRQSSNLV